MYTFIYIYICAFARASILCIYFNLQIHMISYEKYMYMSVCDMAFEARPSFNQVGAFGSPTGTAVSCFLHLESFIERCSRLVPLRPHNDTLVGDKLATIHDPIDLQLVPKPLHETRQVFFQVELLIRFEPGPRHQAKVFASHHVERFL